MDARGGAAAEVSAITAKAKLAGLWREKRMSERFNGRLGLIPAALTKGHESDRSILL